MGNDVSNWRAAIGHFNSKSDNFRKRLITKINVTDLYIFIEIMADLFHDFKQAVKILYFLLMCNTANLHFVYELASLLRIYGDIESNPGPLNSSEAIQCVVSILHLNIRSIRK